MCGQKWLIITAIAKLFGNDLGTDVASFTSDQLSAAYIASQSSHYGWETMDFLTQGRKRIDSGVGDPNPLSSSWQIKDIRYEIATDAKCSPFVIMFMNDGSFKVTKKQISLSVFSEDCCKNLAINIKNIMLSSESARRITAVISCCCGVQHRKKKNSLGSVIVSNRASSKSLSMIKTRGEENKTHQSSLKWIDPQTTDCCECFHSEEEVQLWDPSNNVLLLRSISFSSTL